MKPLSSCFSSSTRSRDERSAGWKPNSRATEAGSSAYPSRVLTESQQSRDTRDTRDAATPATPATMTMPLGWYRNTGLFLPDLCAAFRPRPMCATYRKRGWSVSSSSPYILWFTNAKRLVGGEEAHELAAGTGEIALRIRCLRAHHYILGLLELTDHPLIAIMSVLQ